MRILGELGLDWKTFLIQFLNFVVLFLILKKLFFRRFIAALKDERAKAEKIKNGEEEIRRMKEEMRKQEEDIISKTKKRAEQILDNAETVSSREKEQILEKTEKEVRIILKEARERAEAEVNRIKAGENEKILKKAKDVLKQVLSRSFTKELNKKYIKETIKELEKLDFEKIKEKDIVQVTVISAFPLDAKDEKEISNILFKKINNSAFQQKVDSGLVAGIRVHIDGFLIDGSLAGKINKAI